MAENEGVSTRENEGVSTRENEGGRDSLAHTQTQGEEERGRGGERGEWRVGECVRTERHETREGVRTE